MNLEEIKKGVSELKSKLVALMSGKVELATIKTDKAVLIYDAEELTPGANVFVEDEEGNRTPAPDGEYITEENEKIVVADGKVSEIVEIEETVEEKTKTEETAMSYVTKEEFTAMMSEIRGMFETMQCFAEKSKAESAAMGERLAKVEKMSAGMHPDEQYRTNESARKTGDAKLDAKLERLDRMFNRR